MTFTDTEAKPYNRRVDPFVQPLIDSDLPLPDILARWDIEGIERALKSEKRYNPKTQVWHFEMGGLEIDNKAIHPFIELAPNDSHDDGSLPTLIFNSGRNGAVVSLENIAAISIDEDRGVAARGKNEFGDVKLSVASNGVVRLALIPASTKSGIHLVK